MSDRVASWQALVAHERETDVLSSVRSLLAWDQRTFLPTGGTAWRGEQLKAMSKLMHERATDPRVGDWLTDLEGSNLNALQAASVRNLRRSYDRIVRVPQDLALRLAVASSNGFAAWIEAKSENDFAAFAPHIETLVALRREQAHAMDPDVHPYDALLAGFDPGATVEDLQTLFARLREGLVQLIDALRDVEPMPRVQQAFDPQVQRALHAEVVEALGYDLNHGRIDLAEHPFTMGLHVSDVRITTHLHENDLLGGLGGTIHECGHAMYEQGLPVQHRGTGTDRAASLGLHESQSRFWENYIGRSRPFFKWFDPFLQRHFPGSGVSPEDLYRGANRVVPGPIRVTADEVTYNLHIIARFELEVALIAGTLAVSDLPEAWNQKYEDLLGITPPDPARGVLQDVHWSSGAFGYFPSYTLGNLYAASLGAAMTAELDGLWEQVEAGQFGEILAWLRDRIHRHGHMLDAPDRIRVAVGERDHVEELLSYLWGRHGRLHGVSRPGQ